MTQSKGTLPAPCGFATGVGSRDTPPEKCADMELLGETLARAGYIWRSGGADGADLAFERGARRVVGDDRLQIYLPTQRFNDNPSPLFGVGPQALAMAAALHPVWERLDEGSRQKHARNCYQVLGWKLNQPSDLLICWTEDGCESARTRSRHTGGTATAIVLAERHGIPRFNLGKAGSAARLTDFLAAKGITLPRSICTGDQPSLF